MKVAVAGYSGLIGRHLCKELKKKGFQVVEIPHMGDTLLLDERHALCDAVINLSGINIMHRWSESFKALALASRAGTAHQINHFYDQCSIKPKVFISASAIGYYGDRPNETMIEESKKGLGYLSDLVQKWESSTFDSPIHRIVTFRLGIVLSHDGGALPRIVKLVKAYVGAIVGNPNAYASWVHIDDVVRAMILALDRSQISGVYNLVSDHPVTQKEFMQTLGKAFDRKIFLRIPRFLVTLFAGEAASVVLNDVKAFPKKLKLTGFEFVYPDLESAIASLKSRGL